MTRYTSLLLVLLVSSYGLPTTNADTVLYEEDFEGSLSQWVGKSGGVHHGVIINDPLRAGNSVLSFTSLNGAGDIFSPELSVTPGLKYVLHFEYVGIPGSGTPGDLGGFIGFAEDTPGGHRWLESTSLVSTASGGTTTSNSERDSLIDDGQWRSYQVLFDPFDPNIIAPGTTEFPFTPSNNTIRVMVEDFDESLGVAGDALFDNIRITLVPEPSSFFLVTIGLFALTGMSRRRK